MFTKPSNNDIIPHNINRDLNIIFKDHKDYDADNTIMVSNFLNENSDFRQNDLIIPLYHPINGKSDFSHDGHMYFLMEYLILLDSLKYGSKSNFKKIK